jgi:hypothetical protein
MFIDGLVSLIWTWQYVGGYQAAFVFRRITVYILGILDCSNGGGGWPCLISVLDCNVRIRARFLSFSI